MRFAGAAVIVLATVVVYLPATGNGFVWDDDFYVTENRTLRDGQGLARIWLDTGSNPQYYPLTFTTFWMEYRIWGARPAGYHVVNVLLHAISAVLLWQVLRVLSVPGAWLAGLLFAVHPLQVESVAWITERKNVLSGVFYLAAALLYLRHSIEPRDDGGGNRWRPALAVILFVCALLSKSVTASLPVALAIALWWRQGRLDRKDVPWLGLMLVLGAVAGLHTAWLERHQVGATGEPWTLTFLERCLVAGRALAHYFSKTVWPAGLSFLYDPWKIDATRFVQYLFPAGALAAVGALFALRHRIGRGPIAAALFYGITLFPALGFLNVFPMKYSFVADHFQYLALIGPIALAAGAWARFASNRKEWSRRVVPLIVVLALGGVAISRTFAYADHETLWRDTAARAPRAWLAHYNLGRHLFDRGLVDEALASYRRALEAKPDHADSLLNLGNALADDGRVDEAIAYYERAVRADPKHALLRFNYALALERSGNAARAEEEYRQAIRLTPDPAAGGMAEILVTRGLFHPLPWRAHLLLARRLVARGAREEAVPHFRTALLGEPARSEVLFDLANCLADLGRTGEAIELYRETIATDPSRVSARFNLAVTLDETGRTGEAVEEYRSLLSRFPEMAAAHRNLAILLYRTGDPAGAWREVHAARRLGLEPHPDFLRSLSALAPDPGP